MTPEQIASAALLLERLKVAEEAHATTASLIESLRDQCRALGVTFEPSDAVMSEVRDEDVMRNWKRQGKEPQQLTITITGPQGCGKTTVAGMLRWIADPIRSSARPHSSQSFKDILSKAVIIDGDQVLP